MEAALVVRDLRKSFRSPEGPTLPTIDVSGLALAAGEQVALHGPSGSGKTTLLHLIAGILEADAGHVSVAGHAVTGRREAERDRIRGRHIGYVFQSFHLLSACSVLENVLLAQVYGGGVRPDEARGLLGRLGLGDRLHHRPAQLSVGQRQRAAVARALANRPALVLADEPTGNLDRRNAERALEEVREVCADRGTALLLVSHDPAILERFERVESMETLNRTPNAAEAER